MPGIIVWPAACERWKCVTHNGIFQSPSYLFSKEGAGNMRRAITRTLLSAFIAAASLCGINARSEDAPASSSNGQAVSQAKAELAAALRGLDRFLQTGAAHKAVGWKRYVQWNDLVALTQSDQPPSADVISSLDAKFRASHVGLEMRPFTQVRDALSAYAAATGTAPPEGQLVASARQVGGQPNLYGHTSHRFLAAGVDDYVDRLSGVRDNILGTDIHGTARLTGRTRLFLLDNPSAASMNIVLSGTAVSNNIGYNGPVTIYSTGVTSISAQKPIVMTANGMYGYAAGASCATRSNIYNICAKCGLIEKIAWKRAGQQKGQAEAIASDHAEWRVAGQMNGESGRLIAEQNARYYERFRDPLRRRGAFPEEMVFSSRVDRAEVRIRQDAAGGSPVTGAPPEVADTNDLSVRVHESVVNNFGQDALSGYELTDVGLEKLIRDELKAELPEELRVTLPDGKLDPEKEPWSIIFAKEGPVRTRFSAGGVWIGIRADGFTRGEGDRPGTYRPAITELLEIAAEYKIERTDKGATLRRDGDVQVRFPNRANPEQITVRDSPTVTFIRRKFRNLFKDEFVGEGLVFKGRWERAGRLQLQEIRSDNEWLSLGWQMPASAPAQTTTAGAE
jgi:hypothetical protein